MLKYKLPKILACSLQNFMFESEIFFTSLKVYVYPLLCLLYWNCLMRVQMFDLQPKIILFILTYLTLQLII